jgi:hypothetical protein
MKQRLKEKKEEVKQELHQHTDKNGVPFGKEHPIEAFHKNIITRCSHNSTLVTNLKMANTFDNIRTANLKYSKYLQELPKKL